MLFVWFALPFVLIASEGTKMVVAAGKEQQHERDSQETGHS